MLSLHRLAGIALFGAGLFSPLAAQAGEVVSAPKAVVELFTSQGCSSCPKADRLLSELSERSDVVALAWHVDYWDYIGWSDTFGTPENTARQRGYALALGNRVFTPQLVVNGADDLVGSHRDEVLAGVSASGLMVPLSVSATDSMLDVRIPAKAGAGDAVVWLVTFINRADVTIERGENAGETVTYSHIVVGRQPLGMWSGGDMAFRLPLVEVLAGPADGAAILLQRETNGLPGAILGAAAYQP